MLGAKSEGEGRLNGRLGTRTRTGSALSSVESSAELLLGKNENEKARKMAESRSNSKLVGSGAGDGDEGVNPSLGQGIGLAEDRISRSWDWRMGWQLGATGEDVLRVLRLNVAKELARGGVDGEE